MTPLQSFLTCVRIRATSARATGRKGGASGGAQSPPGWRPAARVRAPRRHWRGLGGLGRPRGLARGRGGAATQPRPRRAPRHRASSGRVGRAPPRRGSAKEPRREDALWWWVRFRKSSRNPAKISKRSSDDWDAACAAEKTWSGVGCEGRVSRPCLVREEGGQEDTRGSLRACTPRRAAAAPGRRPR